jgi:hypothetical protein
MVKAHTLNGASFQSSDGSLCGIHMEVVASRHRTLIIQPEVDAVLHAHILMGRE